MEKYIRLGVNIDHVATVRQARGTPYPSPLEAALAAEQAGADGITLHLREDRRHIQDRDVFLIRECVQTPMNLEAALAPAMLDIAAKVKPAYLCLVPEKREEVTTEGGLDVVRHFDPIKATVERMQDLGVQVSIFIEANKTQITAAQDAGAKIIELHTGAYADHPTPAALLQIQEVAQWAHQQGMQVHAGHGLHYHNVQPIAAIAEIVELNIGHAIVARALSVGMVQAVIQMKQIMREMR